MFNSILLQVAGGATSSLILIGGMFVVMYFFMIRPQQKKQKEQFEFTSNLKKGDKVVTIGGLHGTVVSVGEQTVKLEVDIKGTTLTFEKVAISKDSSTRLSSQA
jgi:preprotein translocase subunit YajC